MTVDKITFTFTWYHTKFTLPGTVREIKNATAKIKYIKTTMRHPDDIWKTLGSCTTINGITDIIMILAARLVGTSVVTPEPEKIGNL